MCSISAVTAAYHEYCSSTQGDGSWEGKIENHAIMQCIELVYLMLARKASSTTYNVDRVHVDHPVLLHGYSMPLKQIGHDSLSSIE